MSLTFAGFVDGLEALSVSGVTRKFTQGPPPGLSTADLPAQYVTVPEGEEGPITVGTSGEWVTFQATLAVAYETAGQSTVPANFDGCVGMMDNLLTALRTFDPGEKAPTYRIVLGRVEISGQMYWAALAEVEVEG